MVPRDINFGMSCLPLWATSSRSSEAQEQLIRGTYARAGLDISNAAHWPHFFEAHGTGTKAGDPREAAAISASFHGETSHGGPLYVGSVKTVIGHTEGTAGLAGVIKASLCLQNGLIPPNMLLRRLNPDIEQYYSNLIVPTQRAIQWPNLPFGEHSIFLIPLAHWTSLTRLTPTPLCISHITR